MDNINTKKIRTGMQCKGSILSNEYAIEKNKKKNACRNYQRIA